MPTDPGYTPDPADVELVADATEAHHILTGRENSDADGHSPCVCGRWWDSVDDQSWDEHLAEAALAALAAAGRLAPADAETRTEYGVRLTWDDGAHVEDLPSGSRDDAQHRVDLHTAMSTDRPGWRATGELISRTHRVGPWLPVPAEDDNPTP